MPNLIDEIEVARLLGIPVSTVRYWRIRGIGPVYAKVGRLVRYDLADVNAYVESNKRRPSVRANQEAGLVGIQAR